MVLRTCPRWNRLLRIGVAIVCVLGLFGGVAHASLVNYPAPLFTLQSLEEKPVSLGSLRGHKVLLWFWEYSCAQCLDLIPYFNALYDALKPSDTVLLSIVPTRRSIDKIRSIVAKHNVRFPVLIGNAAISKRYMVHYMPMLFIVNEEGYITHIYLSPQPLNDMLEQLKLN